MAQIGEPLGDVATKLLFENERVKIWEMRLAPGEEGPLHRHERDHILVQIDGDRMAVGARIRRRSRPTANISRRTSCRANTSTFRAAASRWRATSAGRPTTSS